MIGNWVLTFIFIFKLPNVKHEKKLIQEALFLSLMSTLEAF